MLDGVAIGSREDYLRWTMNLFFQKEFVKYGPASRPYHKDFPTRDTNGTHLPFSRKMGLRRKAEIPFGIAMVPKAGFEHARVSPPPPQKTESDDDGGEFCI